MRTTHIQTHLPCSEPCTLAIYRAMGRCTWTGFPWIRTWFSFFRAKESWTMPPWSFWSGRQEVAISEWIPIGLGLYLHFVVVSQKPISSTTFRTAGGPTFMQLVAPTRVAKKSFPSRAPPTAKGARCSMSFGRCGKVQIYQAFRSCQAMAHFKAAHSLFVTQDLLFHDISCHFYISTIYINIILIY